MTHHVSHEDQGISTMHRRHQTTHRAHGARGRGERGGALLELALVMPFLVMLLLGTVTSALTLNEDLQLTHAAREGARYGATIPDDQTFTSGTWAENVRDLVIERHGEGLTAADVCVALVTGSPPSALSASHTTASGGGACFDDSATGITDARVQVTVTQDAAIETGFATFDVDLSSEATAKHESNG